MPGYVAPCCAGRGLGSRPAGLLPSDLATQTGIMQVSPVRAPRISLTSPVEKNFMHSGSKAELQCNARPPANRWLDLGRLLSELGYQACEENAELCGAAASLVSGQGPPGSPEVCTRPSRTRSVPVMRPDVLEIISCFRPQMKSVPLLAGVVGVEQSLVLSVV
ncbi:hypothetical protein SRHO_G00309960 [Serrasalmus rhombeus]